MNAQEFFKQYPNPNIQLGKKLFKSFLDEYKKPSLINRASVVGSLFKMWLNKEHEDKAKWSQDPYAPFDFSLPGDFIDLKFTQEDTYQVQNVDHSKLMAAQNNTRFSFVLMTPEHWDSEQSKVKLQVHEVLTFTQTGEIISFRPNESSKSFS